ncbi:conserved hypothetical protein [Gloeothece citriformis PCC 7424]|uniref:Cyanobacterial aminoacyl-tRNA synthetase CAAD domain-containing protein n=1 Tax=Gloeothece citriformis (strain PCC 7424) TaxID=65393 RepID=B7KE46_GLOC7|nr:CAAD domain-containing protein [Gloeothece citriformis]ACK71744.1 conserved hypothetical protein [Gloeothece citriformis PCC 7424]
MEAKEQQIDQTTIKTEPGTLAKPSAEQPWMEYVQPVLDTLAKVPDYIGDFFADNKKPLITIGLIIAGLVTVKVTLAVLGAIDDIPLLAPVLELVGLGYTAWFVYRYLLKEESRKELILEFEALKTQVFGNSSNS